MKAARQGQIPTNCYRCGYPIDMTLPSSHPDGPSVEHTTPIAHGGDLTPDLENAALSHLSCNQRHGGMIGANKTNKRKPKPSERNAVTPRFFSDPPSPPRRPAFSLPDRPGKGSNVPEIARVSQSGMRLPRVESDPHPRMVGTWGSEAREWLTSVFGMELRGWQAYALDRALEYDADQRLVWRTVIVTLGRQQGKSFLARGAAMWRAHQAERFGEEQLVLHVANKTSTALEVMRPAARWSEATYGRGSVRWGNTQPGITIPDGSRWMIQAANESAGVGWSSTMCFVDEAWKVKRDVVEGSIAPTMAEREQPQLWLVSTAGDSESDLLLSYRQRAIDRIGNNDPGDILLLEWSAPPNCDIEDEESWKWGSPEWSDKRVSFLRSQYAAIDPAEFKTQYLNVWVHRADHWLSDEAWQETLDTTVDLPEDAHWTVALESEFDWSGHCLAIAAVNDAGQTVIRRWTYRTIREVDERIAQLRVEHPRLELKVTPGYRERIADRHFTLVGRSEAAACTAHLLALFESRNLRHDGDQVLLEHFYRSKISKTAIGWSIVAPGGGLGCYAARAVMFAVGESAKSKPAPIVHVKRR